MSYIVSTSDRTNYIPSMLDGWHPGRPINESAFGLIIDTSTDKDNDMPSFTNPAAAALAREILDKDVKDRLRTRVEGAIVNLRTQLAGANCGSVFSFRKENDQGKHYWYAAIKNGGRWYTTAQAPRVLQNNEEFIEWLIGLEIFDIEDKHFTLGPDETPRAIEAVAVEDA